MYASRVYVLFFCLPLSAYRLTMTAFRNLGAFEDIIHFSVSVYHSLWVWTYSSDDCACHLAVLALGGSAPASLVSTLFFLPTMFDPQVTRNSGTVSDRKRRRRELRFQTNTITCCNSIVLACTRKRNENELKLFLETIKTRRKPCLRLR